MISFVVHHVRSLMLAKAWVMLFFAAFHPVSVNGNVLSTDQYFPQKELHSSSDSKVIRIQPKNFKKFRSQQAQNRTNRAKATAAFVLGKQAEQSNQLEHALSYYLQTEKLDPSYTKITSQIALFYFRSGQTQQGIQKLKKKLKQYPQAADLHSILAVAYLEKQPKQAVSHAKQALHLDPSLLSNYRILAQDLEQKGQNDLLWQLFLDSIQTPFEEASFYQQLGDLWMQILTSNGSFPQNKINQHITPLYEKAHQLSPFNPALSFRLGQLAFESKNYEQAIKHYDKAYLRNPQIPQLCERLALALIKTNQEKRAIHILERYLEDNPHLKRMYPLLGELYEQQQQWAEAANWYLLHVNLGAPNAEDYLRLANAQINSQQVDKALKTINLAENKYPLFPEVYLLKGIILREKKAYPESLAALQRVKALSHSKNKFIDSNFYFQLGATYEQASQPKKAEEALRKALELDPENHTVMNYMAYMWAEKGIKLDEAESILNQALQLSPNNAAYLDSLGWVYFQQKKYQKALPPLKKAEKQDPHDPVIQEHIGDTYEKLNQLKQAIAYWEKALLHSNRPYLLKAKIQAAQQKLE